MAPRSPPNPRRFTHFLSFPLRSPNFTNAAAAFGTALLTAEPPITGMHPSIVMAPVRLHLTIELMSLVKEGRVQDQDQRANSGQEDDDISNGGGTRTISEAIERFETCRAVVDRIIDLRERKSLEVSFDKLATFQTKLDNCQVLYAEPTSETEFLYTLARAVAAHFSEAGFQGDHRPLTLHCTLVNSSKRKSIPSDIPSGSPSSQRQHSGSRRNRESHHKRIPFDASRILSPAPTLGSEGITSDGNRITFDGLGSVPIDRIQLCEMGSSDEEGAYRAIAEMMIWPKN